MFKNRAILTLIPAGAWLCVFMLVPLAIIIFFSLGYKDESGRFLPGFGLHNYYRFIDGPYINSLLRSVSLSALTTAICLIIGFPVSFWLAFKVAKQRRALLMILLTVPLSISFLLRIYAWIIILRPTGLLNSLLLSAGWHNPPVILYSPVAVLLGMVYNYLPFMILPLYASLEKLDYRLIEAARDLGAAPAQAFWRITVPSSSRGIVAGVILVFVPALGDYITPDLMGGAKYMYIGSLIQNQYLAVQDWAFGAAVSTILLVLISGCVWIYLRYADDGSS